MKNRTGRRAALALAVIFVTALAARPVPAQDTQPVIALHGGAGTILRENMTSEREEAYRGEIRRALEAGWAVLDRGGPALDAVEAAIRLMEDSPLFNAGKGAVFTHEGRNELDASIMDGATRDAGAVAGVSHVKNPISLARLVMERSPHVMLAREGAEEFALEMGVEMVPASYFFTEGRWESLQRARERERETASPGAAEEKRGTVGVVALDRAGRLAAGTSTGGMTNKRWGRIGDSPVIAAGTWADDRCAVSATGHGEFFIRNAVAHDICARMRYLAIPLRDAADQVIMDVLVAQDAEGGVIALDRDGAVAAPFNTPGMYRGWIVAGGEPVIRIYRDED